MLGYVPRPETSEGLLTRPHSGSLQNTIRHVNNTGLRRAHCPSNLIALSYNALINIKYMR